MDLVHPQAKRLYDSLEENVGGDAAEELLSRLPISKAPSDARRAEWAESACQALSDALDGETAERVRRACHCAPPQGEIAKLRKLWLACGDMAQFARRAGESKAAFSMEADGNALVMIYPRCYCAFVKKSAKPLPALWCACTLGYAEAMFSDVFGKPVDATLLESVISGGARCRIRVAIR